MNFILLCATSVERHAVHSQYAPTCNVSASRNTASTAMREPWSLYNREVRWDFIVQRSGIGVSYTWDDTVERRS